MLWIDEPMNEYICNFLDKLCKSNSLSKAQLFAISKVLPDNSFFLLCAMYDVVPPVIFVSLAPFLVVGVIAGAELTFSFSHVASWFSLLSAPAGSMSNDSVPAVFSASEFVTSESSSCSECTSECCSTVLFKQQIKNRQ